MNRIYNVKYLINLFFFFNTLIDICFIRYNIRFSRTMTQLCASFGLISSIIFQEESFIIYTLDSNKFFLYRVGDEENKVCILNLKEIQV